MNVKAQKYARALYSVLDGYSGKPDAVCKEFASLLVSRGDSGLVGEIERSFKELYRQKEGVVFAEVESALPLHDRVLNQSLFGKKVKEIDRVDESAVSGARIRVGDVFIDNTFSRRMRDLKNALQQ